MAMASGTAAPGNLPGVEPWAVTVKNTFISVTSELAEIPGPAGRPSSLPPSIRLPGSDKSCAHGAGPVHSGGRKPVARQTDAQKTRFGSAVVKAGKEEDASTEADSFRGEEDASTESFRGEEDASTEGENCAEEEAPAEAEPPGPLLPVAAGVVSAPCCQSRTDLNKVFGPPGPLLQPRLAATPGARLNAAARAWTPNAAVAGGVSEASRRFHLQMERIVQAAQAMLMGCLSIVAVDITRGACGWTISAKIAKEEFHSKELVLTRAKEAFLMAAEASENVYVLGYLARPFVATPVGFGARFAAVPDEHKACWGLLKNGVCQFGDCCRWQHPECQATVNVQALIATEVV